MARTRNITNKKTLYIFTEGGYTGSEWKYIRALCNKYNCLQIIKNKDSYDPLNLIKLAIDFSKSTQQRTNDKGEIWVVFDNDFPQKVKEAFVKANNYNATVIKKSKMPLNIAYNAPSFETWGLLCCGERRISENRKTNEELLKHKMPGYDHSRGATFDFDKMDENVNTAIELAKSWKISLGNSPEYTTNKFAGIYKLVLSVMS